MSTSNLPLRIYTPDSSVRRPLLLLREMVRDLLVGRELAWRLAVRDIRSQYRQSFLGIAWAFVMPFATTLAWIFLSRTGIISVGATDLPYPLYVFSGTMLWSIFMDTLNMPLTVTNASKAMLTKVNFPKEALVMSGLCQVAFNSVIKIGLLFLAMLVIGIMPGWRTLMFPLGLLSLGIAGLGVGLFLTPIGTLYTDVGRIVSLGLQFAMYVTPVVFPMPETGWVAVLFRCNPVTPLILTSRSWLVGLPGDHIVGFSLVTCCAVLLLLISWLIFRIGMPIIVERMNA